MTMQKRTVHEILWGYHDEFLQRLVALGVKGIDPFVQLQAVRLPPAVAVPSRRATRSLTALSAGAEQYGVQRKLVHRQHGGQ